MLDAREIANFLLDYADQERKPLTNMALLKVIYYAHGWHLKMFSKPLVKNTFEAWPHGPVIKVVYEAFKGNKDQNISNRAKKFNPIKNEEVIAQYNFENNLISFLKSVFDVYAGIDAITLSKMTHEADGPWDITMKKSRHGVCMQLKIQNDIIKDYFDRSNTWTM